MNAVPPEIASPARAWSERVAFPMRWLLLVVLAAVAFRAAWAESVREVMHGDSIGYQLALPLWVLIAVLGIRQRRVTDLPIHDKETDGIVAGATIAVAVAGELLLEPRLSQIFELWRPDLFGVWVFTLGVAILLFGLRPVSRFRGAWLVWLLVFPLPYRVMAVVLGGSTTCLGLLDTVLTAAVVASLFHGRWLRQALVAAAAIALGTATVLGTRGAAVLVVQLAPVVTIVAALVVYLAVTGQLGVFFTPQQRSVAVGPLRRRVAVATVAAVIALFAAPGQPASPPPTTVVATRAALAAYSSTSAWPAAAGWQVTGSYAVDWMRRYYGAGATWRRQVFVAGEGNPAWDKDSMPRTVVVDTLTVTDPATLTLFPLVTSYPIAADRMRAPVAVSLGDGVFGQLTDAVDENSEVTLTMLTLTWSVAVDGARRAQRITLISSDDHLASATFPSPAPSLGGTIRAALGRILRGDSSSVDTNSSPKDAAMLTSVGAGLVSAVTGAST